MCDWSSRPKPEISGQARPDLVLIRSPDQVQGLLAVADRAAQDDKAVTNKPSMNSACSSRAS